MIVDDIAAAGREFSDLVAGATVVRLPFPLVERRVVDDEDGNGWTEFAWIKTDFQQFLPKSYEWCRSPMPRMILVGNSSAEVGFISVESVPQAGVAAANRGLGFGLDHPTRLFEICIARLWVRLGGKVGPGYPGFIRFGICNGGTAWFTGPDKGFAPVTLDNIADLHDGFLDPATVIMTDNPTNPFPLRISTSVLVAFALMNCSNIRTVPVEHEPRVQARRVRRGGLPLVRYHVLKIGPARAGARAGRERGMSDDMALHWVRGHFKEYGGENGLFGKHRGVYWWSPHLAGTADRIVTKDYAIDSVG